MTGKEKMAPETAVFYMRKIKEAFEEGHLNTEAEALQMGINALQQPEPQWIPCSERLPEEYGRYLVTRRKFGKLEATWNIFYGGEHASWLWNDESIAWMPLPEPWRGES